MAGDRCRSTTDQQPRGLSSRRYLATCSRLSRLSAQGRSRELPIAMPLRSVNSHGRVGHQLCRVPRVRLDRNDLLDASFLSSSFELERDDVEFLGGCCFWKREFKTLTVRGDGGDPERLVAPDDDLSSCSLAKCDDPEKDVVGGDGNFREDFALNHHRYSRLVAVRCGEHNRFVEKAVGRLVIQSHIQTIGYLLLRAAISSNEALTLGCPQATSSSLQSRFP